MNFQGSTGFRTHAGRIIAVFDEAIVSLSDDDYLPALERIWSKIGESHNKRQISRQAFHVSRQTTLLLLLPIIIISTIWQNIFVFFVGFE